MREEGMAQYSITAARHVHTSLEAAEVGLLDDSYNIIRAQHMVYSDRSFVRNNTGYRSISGTAIDHSTLHLQFRRREEDAGSATWSFTDTALAHKEQGTFTFRRTARGVLVQYTGMTESHLPESECQDMISRMLRRVAAKAHRIEREMTKSIAAHSSKGAELS